MLSYTANAVDFPMELKQLFIDTYQRAFSEEVARNIYGRSFNESPADVARDAAAKAFKEQVIKTYGIESITPNRAVITFETRCGSHMTRTMLTYIGYNRKPELEVTWSETINNNMDLGESTIVIVDNSLASIRKPKQDREVSITPATAVTPSLPGIISAVPMDGVKKRLFIDEVIEATAKFGSGWFSGRSYVVDPFDEVIKTAAENYKQHIVESFGMDTVPVDRYVLNLETVFNTGGCVYHHSRISVMFQGSDLRAQIAHLYLGEEPVPVEDAGNPLACNCLITNSVTNDDISMLAKNLQPIMDTGHASIPSVWPFRSAQ